MWLVRSGQQASDSVKFSSLLPDFGALVDWLGGGAFSPEAFSTAFILFILIIFMFCLAWAWIYWWCGAIQVGILTGELNSHKRDDLIAKRRGLVNKAKRNFPKTKNGRGRGTVVGHLWLEFDESLVEDEEQKRLYNTLDADHFFNDLTLFPRLNHGRVLSAMPGVLTAFGLIGTFVGLTTGLSEIDPKNVHDGALNTQIMGVIGGATIAFKTSVWGVVASVLLTLMLRSAQGAARAKVGELQRLVDDLFPRLTAERSLMSISDHGKVSRETLQGLAEQIGTRFQHALDQSQATMQETLTDALQNVLGPAVDALARTSQNLVERQGAGTEKAIEGMVQHFMAELGGAGRQQAELMREAARGFQESAGAFANQFHEQSKRADLAQAEQKQAFDAQLAALSEAQRRSTDELRLALSAILDRVGDHMDHVQAQADQVQARREAAATSMIERITKAGGDSAAALAQIVEEQHKGVDTLVANADLLAEKMAKAGETMHGLSAQLDGSTQAIAGAGAEMNAAANRIRDMLEEMSHAVRAAAQSTDNAAQANETAAQEARETLAAAKTLTESLQGMTANMERAGQTVETSFAGLKDQQEAFLISLRQEFEALGKSVGDMLNAYAEQIEGQTRERLNQWNEQTAEYTSAMTNAIHVLAGVVDELESKTVSVKPKVHA